MPQDFAKRKKDSGKRRASARKKPSQRRAGDHRTTTSGGVVRPFLTGLMTGVFLSFLVYLGTLTTPQQAPTELPQPTQSEAQPPKPRFDFYTLLTDPKTEVEVERAANVSKPSATSATADVYILQAGSFRQRDDADRRRAELLLLGLEPRVEHTQGDNGRWFRVYLGPFPSRSLMARARSLTAGQDIDTLLLKRELP